jgi:hypothetical protein
VCVERQKKALLLNFRQRLLFLSGVCHRVLVWCFYAHTHSGFQVLIWDKKTQRDPFLGVFAQMIHLVFHNPTVRNSPAMLFFRNQFEVRIFSFTHIKSKTCSQSFPIRLKKRAPQKRGERFFLQKGYFHSGKDQMAYEKIYVLNRKDSSPIPLTPQREQKGLCAVGNIATLLTTDYQSELPTST